MDAPGGQEVGLLVIDGFPAVHGFTLRHAGVSTGPHASLNLGEHVGDAIANVNANRARVRVALGIRGERLRLLRQVHGDRIVDWTDPRFRADAPPEADAHMSDDPRDALVVAVADCLPILYHDPVTGAAAAAHCGWRGTAARVSAAVVEAMAVRFGSRASDLAVAIGPGIAGACYQVGGEVIAAIERAGYPRDVARTDLDGRYRLDLAAANRHALVEAGVDPARIAGVRSCTHCDSERFFSYRRDGPTGRHWAVVRPGDAGSMGDGETSRDHAASARAGRMSMGSRADA